jgi:cyclase
VTHPRHRVIPVLLLNNGGLWKTRRFRDPVYLGDPVNVTRIFNDKEADELIVLGIDRISRDQAPAFGVIVELAGECSMPLAYGGGVSSLEDVRRLVGCGVEKVSLNRAAVEQPEVVEQAARVIGSQSVVVAIDVAARPSGERTVRVRGGSIDTGLEPTRHALQMEQAGAGEILLTSIDREGTGSGYDLGVVEEVSAAVSIPVVAHGGAAGVEDLRAAIRAGASAVAASGMFVLYGRHRAPLITYPSRVDRAIG